MPNPPHQAHNPEVVELDASAPVQDIVEVIKRDGGIIIKNFLSPETIDKIHEEAQPYWGKLGTYQGKLFDAGDPPLRNVYRDGSRYTCVSNPVLAVSEAFNRGSPSTAQQLHRDDMAQHFDHLEGSGESSLLGLLVAGVVRITTVSTLALQNRLTREPQDTNFVNGATQVIVGSHKWPEAAIKGPADRSLCSTCEMSKGDAVFIIGSIWHGAGENKTNPPERRIIYSCHMTRGSLRADENQYLAIEHDTIKTYDPEVQALLGYSVSHPNCGHVDMEDPITLLGSKSDPFGYGDIGGKQVVKAN
ncbi:hypothetical protein Neosp_015225 [[Neocosmospora] mangrovei]